MYIHMWFIINIHIYIVVFFSPVPGRVDADCWNRFFVTPSGTRNTVVIVMVYICIYIYMVPKFQIEDLHPNFDVKVFRP